MILSADEIRELEKFRLSTKRAHSPLSIRVDQLLHEETLTTYLEMLQRKLGAPNMIVTASILMKRYSFLAVMALYAMSVWNKRLSIAVHQVWLETEDSAETWLPAFRLEQFECEEVNAARDQWRKETIQILFARHMNVLIERLCQTTKISPLILWENVAIYIFWLYETLLEDKTFAHINEQLRDDFHFVIQEAKGELFGRYSQNPLARFWKEKTYSSLAKKEIRRRTTCCLYYKIATDRSHCQTCPLGCND
jgi:ferric iron reductase protein FhuF